MSDMRELSIDEIINLGTPAPRKTKTSLDTSDRSVTNWFKFRQSLGFCSNSECKDDRERRVAEGNAMVSDIDGIVMCRICFVEGYDGN